MFSSFVGIKRRNLNADRKRASRSSPRFAFTFRFRISRACNPSLCLLSLPESSAFASNIGTDSVSFIPLAIAFRTRPFVQARCVARVMAMRMTTVRLSEPLYRELQRMSEQAGVSIAQWLREAAIAQLNFEKGVEWGRQQALSDPNTQNEPDNA